MCPLRTGALCKYLFKLYAFLLTGEDANALHRQFLTIQVSFKACLTVWVARLNVYTCR